MSLAIPVDLYRPIVEEISDRNTLYSLLIASHNLNTEAERVLYRDFRRQDIISQTLFFQRVITCQRVANLVRRCHAYRPQSSEDHGDPFQTLFPAALRALINLKELRFVNYDGNPMAHILRGCTFELESLEWGCIDDEAELMAFFAVQKSLKILDVAWNEDIPGPPLSSLPQLSVLTGGYNAICALLPGRKITHLYFEPNVDEAFGDATVLSEHFSHLRVFVLICDFAQPLPLFIKRYRNLEFLELDGAPMKDLRFLPLLLNLKGLVLRQQWGRSRSIVSLDESNKLVLQLYSKMKSLRFIDIEVKERGQSSRHFRWKRDVGEPIDVSHEHSPSKGGWDRFWISVPEANVPSITE